MCGFALYFRGFSPPLEGRPFIGNEGTGAICFWRYVFLIYRTVYPIGPCGQYVKEKDDVSEVEESESVGISCDLPNVWKWSIYPFLSCSYGGGGLNFILHGGESVMGVLTFGRALSRAKAQAEFIIARIAFYSHIFDIPSSVTALKVYPSSSPLSFIV